MNNIPLLWNHDPTAKPIGSMYTDDGRLMFYFTEDVQISDEMMFEIFGDAGILVLDVKDSDGVRYIKRGQILEFSFTPPK